MNRSIVTPGALALGVLLLTATPAAAAPGDIRTAAGSAGSGPATGVSQTPNAVAVVDGGLLVTDDFYGVVRRVDLASGRETVIAGNGTKGLLGNGGPALEAQLCGGTSNICPQQVSVAPDGDLLVAEPGRSSIRRVDSQTGTITTAAGTGTFGNTGDGGAATEARLGAPFGVVVEPDGDLLIADTSNNRIRRVDASSGSISTIAGGGAALGDGGPATSARLSGPRGLALQADGGLLVADRGQHRIRRIAPDGSITTVAGTGAAAFSGDGGAATAAALSSPAGVTALAGGDFLVADTANRRVRAVRSGTIGTLAGDGTTCAALSPCGDDGAATAAQLAAPTSTAVDSAGVVYVADGATRRVRSVNPDGTIRTFAGNGRLGSSGDGGPAPAAQLYSPFGTAVGPDGDLYVSDTVNHRVRRIDVASGVISTIAGSGVQCADAASPCGDGGPALDAQLSRPWGVGVDAAGNVFFVDNNLRRVRRIDAGTGTLTTVAGSGGPAGFSGDNGPATSAQFTEAQGLAVAGDGTLFIADVGNNRIRRVDPRSGTITTVAGMGIRGFAGDGGAATAAALASPNDVALAPDGDLVIADTGNVRVRRVDSGTGTITSVAGNGTADFTGDGGPATQASLRSPRGVAVDAADSIFIADTSNNRVRRVDSDGVITTVAGDGAANSRGDGGPATGASLFSPWKLAVTPAGDVTVAEQNGQRLRLIEGVAAASQAAPPPVIPEVPLPALLVVAAAVPVAVILRRRSGAPLSG